MMKKIIFGIFAHPDDEAFGPAGTLLMETQSGSELHLISLTAGENGTNTDNHENLGDIRLKEWLSAATLLGAKQTYHLGFVDGHLDNIAMIEAAQKIETIVRYVVENRDPDTTVEFMTIDSNGITGHIDHIVASRAASLVFYRIKPTDNRFTKIKFACLPYEQNPTIRTDWIYMDVGRRPDEIGETVDARHIAEQIKAVMYCHSTQKADYDAALARRGDNLGLNYFIVKN